MKQESYHEGRPIVRNSPEGKRVVVLCPYGHYHTSIEMKDWAGSWLEAKASDPNWTIKCHGTIAR